MPSERFFFPFSLKEKHIQLEGKEFHHLFHVMRLQEKDSLELVNGKGELASGIIETIDKKKGALIALLSHKEEKENPFSLILAQALTRPNLLDWIIEKGCELGVYEFWLFPGDKSEKRSLSTSQLARLELLAISALKQSGRLFLPQIVVKPPLSQWEKIPFFYLFGDLAPQAPSLLDIKIPPGKTVFIIGPEKGISQEELSLLKNRNAQGIKLHNNTLRAETAALTAACHYSFLTLYQNEAKK